MGSYTGDPANGVIYASQLPDDGTDLKASDVNVLFEVLLDNDAALKAATTEEAALRKSAINQVKSHVTMFTYRMASLTWLPMSAPHTSAIESIGNLYGYSKVVTVTIPGAAVGDILDVDATFDFIALGHPATELRLWIEAVQSFGDSNVVANVPGAVAVFDSSASIGPRTRATLMGRFTVAVAGSMVVRLAVANGGFGRIFKLMGTGALRTTLAHLGAP